MCAMKQVRREGKEVEERHSVKKKKKANETRVNIWNATFTSLGKKKKRSWDAISMAKGAILSCKISVDWGKFDIPHPADSPEVGLWGGVIPLFVLCSLLEQTANPRVFCYVVAMFLLRFFPV